MLTDTHCHIHEAASAHNRANPTHAWWRRADDANPDHIIARAQKSGVSRMVCVGTSAADSELAVQFVANRPQCWASIGLHPHDAKDGEPALQRLAALLQGTNHKIVAVGECGLDYFYNHSDKKAQEKALRFQIELALQHDLPLIFHVRDAFDDFWPIFDSYQRVRGVLHSFTDNHANLDKALTRNLHIGVNGIATFSKDSAWLDSLKAIPLQKILLETDAPFLTPVPFRGKVNEPAHVRLVAAFIAKLRGEDVDLLGRQTSSNAQTLFSL